MKLNNTSILLITACLLGLVVFIAAVRTVVFASSTTITVQVGPPAPVDVCPNIPGVQASIPDGMIKNSSGNCVTPEPEPIDLCENISGNQEVIPSGYYRDSNGNCYPQPDPPAPVVDVCPNLAGVHTSLPNGYIYDAEGNCVLPPVDLCSNIDGIQSTLPAGLAINSNGLCYTPASPAQPDPGTDSDPEPDTDPGTAAPTTPSTSEPRQPGSSSGTASASSPVPANIPAAFAPIVRPLVDIVPENIKQAVRSLPPVVAQSFPYYVFAILGISASVLWLQAMREAIVASSFIALLKRERSIAEQKDNFIALASHYLRTPLTVMSNGIDAIVSMGEVTADSSAALRSSISSLHGDIENILADVQNNEQLREIQSNPTELDNHSFIRSWHFWLPIIISVGITLFANFLLGVVGEVELGTLNLVVQIAIFVMIGFFFYSALRNHRTRKRNRAQQELLIANERAIDDARNTFLRRATVTLQRGLLALYNERIKITGSEHINFFDDGYTRFLAILDKFNLLAKLRTSQTEDPKPFNLKPLVDGVIVRHSKAASDKQITVTSNLPPLPITQQRELIEFVIDSLIDNAIKFTDNGGSITIDASPNHHKISLSISDTGTGIAADKLPQLFKPFSRTESAVEFNYEGLGFSLFLNRIIMDYLDGDISVKSQPERGSTFTITADSRPPKQPALRPGAAKSAKPIAA